ncbi:MAG: DpnII family type II restriction endonuclease, partial [Candidatus Pacearchaeota archaeon]
MTQNYNDKYLEFASNISFFEFLQEEFKKAHFKVENYTTEIKELSEKDKWDIKELSKFLRERPKSFEIFEEIFQLARFTNTQLIHFLFDTSILNSTDKNRIIEYLIRNLKFDNLFANLFLKHSNKSDFDNIKFDNVNNVLIFLKKTLDVNSINYVTLLLKETVISYIDSAIKNAEIVHERLSNKNFPDVSERTAEYLIKNLNLNDILEVIKIKEYLATKRIPVDTKSIHGNFGKIKITKILEKHNFVNAEVLFDKANIKILNYDLSKVELLKELKGKFIFVTERYIEGINKRNDRKPKKFDFVLLYDLTPKIGIETNVYSTAGTKIGINQGEYIDLNDDIKRSHKYLIFIWITDGNYWLTSDGKSRLLNLYSYFGDH